jgi:class 3 adenylate cyclase/tetratricopeptide (TPR) repeat protein
MVFCGMCGTRLATVCPACGFANPSGYRFCGQCGARLTGQPMLTPSPPLPSAAQADVGRASVGELHPIELSAQPGAETVPLPPVQLDGERRLATVVLTDVSGSTDLLERIGTESWVEIMNRVLHILESEVYRFGGRVDQFRGDGLVALFGATSAHEDDPENAVLAGLAMQRALKPYAAVLAEQEGIDLRLRVGVNTGEVIVASVGDSHRYSEDTAMGAGPALAARMEAAAEPGTVLVSENTYRLVRSRFEWQPLGKITVKGVGQPVAVYRPLAPLADAVRTQRLQTRELSKVLIGRIAEFEALKRCVKDLYDGRGGIAMVAGDRGMGKSFLVTTVRQHFIRLGALLAEAQNGGRSPSAALTWLRGRCRSYSQSWPYSVWRNMLYHWLDVGKADSRADTADRLYRQAQLLWGGSADTDRAPGPTDRQYLAGITSAAPVDEHYPYLATFLSLPLEDTFAERVKHLDAEGLRQQFFFTLRSWVEAMARRGPLVLAFSDAQWADTTSLDLLEYCLPLCDHEALLWLIVFRPERTSPVWEFRHRVETGYPHRVTSLTLAPLTETQGGEFIDHLIGPDALPEETRQIVLAKSEGNPYYVRELVYSLIEQGALERDAETTRWRATRAVTSLDVPDTLQSLLLARIDRLSPGERRVLQMAAVIGAVFWWNVLRALASDATLPEEMPRTLAIPDRRYPDGKVAPPAEAEILREHLTALQRAGLIHERGRVPELGMEYAFDSALIRGVVYDSLLSTQRVAYHLRVAEYLEDLLTPEAWLQYAGTLAYHYRGAGKPGKDLFYTLQAAERAQGIYANAEAVEHYTRALELLDAMEQIDGPQRLAISASGGLMEAQASDEDWLYAIRTRRFEVLSGRCSLFHLMGRFESERADALALLELAEHLGDDPVWRIDALLQQFAMMTHWQSRGRLDTGVSMAEEALALARQIGDQRREMQALFALANQRVFLDDPAWQEAGERALELARQLEDRRYEAHILINLGTLYSWTDRPERGMAYLEAALSICQTLDDKIAEVHLLDQFGLEAERKGDYCRLLTEYHQKRLEISRAIGYREGEGTALVLCGQTQSLYLGDYEEGLALLEEARRILENTPAEIFVLLRVVQIGAVLGRYEGAPSEWRLQSGNGAPSEWRLQSGIGAPSEWRLQSGIGALEALERMRHIDEQTVFPHARAGLRLVSAILYNAMGGADNYILALDLAAQARQLVDGNPLLTPQYEIAVAHESAVAHLGLARCVADADVDRASVEEQKEHIRLAVESSQTALDLYRALGFVQIIECVSEELLFRHSLALEADGCHAEAADYLQRAYEEMMRKHALIPPDSQFYRTYLENVPLHRAILAAHGAQTRE